MSQQHIIYPETPLLIVHKGWHVKSGKAISGPDHSLIASQRISGENVSITVLKQKSSNSISSPIGASSISRNESIGKSNSAHNWQFINATNTSRDRDPEVRRLVKSHVMKGVHSDEKARKTPRKKNKAFSLPPAKSPLVNYESNSTRATSISSAPSPTFPGSAISLYGGLSFAIKPQFRKLMDYYLFGVSKALYPYDSHFAYNPVKAAWFPLAITDEVLFHTILLTSAIHLSSSVGTSRSEEQSTLMELVLRPLSKRLRGEGEQSDATLGAVSCLAMTENSLGNHEKWKMHMKGLSEMIRMKGGLSSTDEGLQMKICRADIEGAVDFVSTPLLTPLKRTQPPIYTSVPSKDSIPPDNDFLKLLISSGLDSRLVNAFIDLQRFSHALEYALKRPEISFHPRAFDEDMILIQYELLSISSADEHSIQEACRLGALIYVKSITRERPFSSIQSSIIVRKLKAAMLVVSKVPNNSPLLLWLYFMGGTASQGPAERDWFAFKLAELGIHQEEYSAWENVKRYLKKYLWIQSIHETPSEQLWDDVETTRIVLYGQF